jgi:hypothetical protein
LDVETFSSVPSGVPANPIVPASVRVPTHDAEAEAVDSVEARIAADT